MDFTPVASTSGIWDRRSPTGATSRMSSSPTPTPTAAPVPTQWSEQQNLIMQLQAELASLRAELRDRPRAEPSPTGFRAYIKAALQSASITALLLLTSIIYLSLFYLHTDKTMSAALTQLVPVLTGANWQDWAPLMEAYLMAQGQWYTIIEMRPEPSTTPDNASDPLPFVSKRLELHRPVTFLVP
ncbi:hypothetical protein HYDPIDRAFT_34631 [Hydnomerulius pinastri MD-312]|uniref:Uncharacterized protein n=1 Tax=Hydnomerulius pinastri MD-312 TaxID=994086 RepID=A0A0C9UY56_9AGAM|nr:hypothetical protein HYDPIDRAFT_34631 [Hydnomerulius pinastri MD-312]